MRIGLKKLMFHLAVCGGVWVVSPATAQISSMLPDETAITHYSSGKEINIVVTFIGRFDKGKTVALPSGEPQLRLIVNGEKAYAALKSISPELSGTWKTKVTYTYTVKPGDMAEPLKVYTPWEVPMNGWAFYDVAQPYTFFGSVLDAFTPVSWTPTTLFDFTMAGSKVTIKTLAFNDLLSTNTVQAGMTETWRVKTDKDVGTGVFDFRVWTPNTNIVQVGTVAGADFYQGTLGAAVAPATYSESAPFAVKGLRVGSAVIYVQRVRDHLANTYAAGTLNPIVWTNYIRRVMTVTASAAPPAPPPQSVCVVSSPVVFDESGTAGTGQFTVTLSEAYPDHVTVSLKTLPPLQSNIALYANSLTFAPGQPLSQTVRFSARDGTALSKANGICVVPGVTGTGGAAAYFIHAVSNAMYVANVNPAITFPSADMTGLTQGIPFRFSWLVNDVPADTNSTMSVNWEFGDGSEAHATGASGGISHTYTDPGDYMVALTVTDKNGGCDIKIFKVTVQTAPFITLIKLL